MISPVSYSIRWQIVHLYTKSRLWLSCTTSCGKILLTPQNLTEFNTAHNKRVATLPLEDITPKFPRRKRKSVAFAEDEEIINPGDF